MDNVIPRYVQGNVAEGTPKGSRICSRSMPSQLIGSAALLLKFVFNPVTFRKISRIYPTILISSCEGFTKSAKSSAYKETLIVAARPLNFESTPCSVARSKILCSGSMAMMNRKGDSGSPCLNPCLCQICTDWTPFTMTIDEEDERINAIHSHHLVPNPMA